MQTKVYTSFPYSVLKKASHKPLKVAADEFFPSKFIIDTTCFGELFSFHMITANNTFYTNLSLPRGLVQPPCCCVLSSKCFERSLHFIFITSTIILRRCQYSKGSKQGFYFFFYTVSFCKCSTLFSINEIFITQKLPGGMFLLKAIIKFIYMTYIYLFSKIV